MAIKETGIEGLIEFQPQIYTDNRGFFFEAYKEDEFNKLGINYKFVQDNQSFSYKGVIRGLHLQLPPYAQAKLVKVIQGKVLDVVVDLRKNSKTYGKHYKCLLEGYRNNALMVPEGFAHGFAALEDSVFQYKCSSLYTKSAEAGILWNDKSLNIDWQVAHPIISEKDNALPTFKTFEKMYIET